ncbi:hypothetical protein MRB53_004892 [Persea americana]|uniref:Uncharacterized protein n=1 Tax=Persea americana TaxID=3435 RepID=A0ACC2MC02_PERAE|nr:hypothetical protein MRB53_004892 [Persea americana]
MLDSPPTPLLEEKKERSQGPRSGSGSCEKGADLEDQSIGPEEKALPDLDGFICTLRQRRGHQGSAVEKRAAVLGLPGRKKKTDSISERVIYF